VARAALHLAGEDDAVASRSAIPLPVESYLERVERLCDDYVACHRPEGQEHASLSASLDAFLYETSRFRLPTAWSEMYSPYRTYLHHVLAQKVGVRCALATVHQSVLQRLQARAALPAALEVALPPGSGLPFTRVRGAAAALSSESLLRETLDGLARAYWAWEWLPEHSSGFLAAARAASGSTGRVGRVVAGTVMQPTGRPFGDLQRAQLALERSVALSAETGVETRDLGALLAHIASKRGEALVLLRRFRDSEAGRELAAQAVRPPSGVAASLVGAVDAKAASRAAEETQALHDLILALEKAALEKLL